MPTLPLRGLAGVAAALWVGGGIVLYALMRWRTAPRGKRYTPEMLGMILAHFGVALFLAGVLITEATSVESDLRFAPNETKNVGGLDFRFHGVEHAQGPNYVADQGTIEVLRDGTRRRDAASAEAPVLRRRPDPDQVRYRSGPVPRSLRRARRTAAIRTHGAWAVRVYVKPFVRWIWLGGLFMMFGGFVAATDRRFRALPERATRDDAAPISPRATTHPHPALPLKGRAWRMISRSAAAARSSSRWSACSDSASTGTSITK